MSLMDLWADRELFISLKMATIVKKGVLVIYQGLLHMRSQESVWTSALLSSHFLFFLFVLFFCSWLSDKQAVPTSKATFNLGFLRSCFLH